MPMPRRMRMLDLSVCRDTTLCTRKALIHLVCLRKMQRLNEVRMHVNGLTKILKQLEDNFVLWVPPMTGHVSWLHRILNTTDGINISFCSSIKMA